MCVFGDGMKKSRWTPEEEKTLRDHYFDTPMIDLLLLLPNRTRVAIKGHAVKLKLKRDDKFQKSVRIKPVHGHSIINSRAYKLWCSMRTRCFYPKHRSYKYYGGKGIVPCDEWNDFANFYNDMGDPPDGMTLGRIDNTKGYCKENCRWETMKDQGNNRSSNRLVTAFGETLTLQQWANKTGVTRAAIEQRLNKGVMTNEEAVTKPVKKTKPFVHWRSGRVVGA